MLEGLALSLLNTLASFIFENYLKDNYTVTYGVPNWFYKESQNELCSFDYIYGNYIYVDKLKYKLEKKLQNRIKDINNKVVYVNFKNAHDPKEKAIINKFKDGDYRNFVHFNISFSKIEYSEELNRLFGKACIQKNVLMKFSKKRLQEIVHNVSLYHADKSFNQLDEEIGTDEVEKELEMEDF